MRRLLITIAALSLAACNQDGPAENQAATDQGLTAETIGSNDLTAIDAVTAEDANMAADMPLDANMDLNALENSGDGNGSSAANAVGNAD